MVINILYETITVPEENEEVFKVKRLEVGEDILFCSWSKKGAAKDRAYRQRLIERAQKLLKTKPGSILDETKIARDSLWN